MPELPEVETIKKTLEHLVINKTIQNITIHWPNIIKHPDDTEQFKQIVQGQTIHRIDRRGKFLLFYLDHHVLISHLRMEGKYGVFPKTEPVNKHTHVIFELTDGKELRYQDVRKFGTMHVFSIGDEFNCPPLDHLGPEPFEKAFTVDYLKEKLNKTNRHIKTALLDQTVVAGLGNIYVDEALFRSSIHPMRRASDLSDGEITSLHHEIIETLGEAVTQGGTTIRSYVNSQGQIGMFQQKLNVYGREEEACHNCGKVITKMKVGNRGTHVCLNCQK
ncbi:DNA-formamidopyrimidine glycosylase [Pontibacillus marinus]|uniref:Formamidopyrimidine-DNA glycosylase n=1 Tax=Pontibacillus marinus BH030004 = DSM 16465 TaxID=1385511 RepID=A0A0A5FXL8_9BACI|nr:DNA-formamidopyrimidine glycosylase [Pontibacillus marinus]KGX83573.1 5-hydroxymethyluracil DNA glycosylase [Pontibacillus marinus BH030004 = DSM 16465]